MAGNDGTSPKPINRYQAVGGLLCILTLGVLAVIDAMSEAYTLELGFAALLLGTGTVLLGAEGLRKAANRIVNDGP